MLTGKLVGAEMPDVTAPRLLVPLLAEKERGGAAEGLVKSALLTPFLFEA